MKNPSIEYHNSKFLFTHKSLAVIETKIPQAVTLFFPDLVERPTEAPSRALEKKRCNEELQ